MDFFENRSIFRFMEPFAIWNLLKNILSTPNTPANAGKPDELNTAQTNDFLSPTQSKSEGENQDFTANSPTRQNACEAYFLRHEQLKSRHKK